MAPPPGRGDEQDPGAEPILAGLRVLDLTDEFGVAGPRLLAALGAEVLRPELPGGDDLRVRRPSWSPEGEAGRASPTWCTTPASRASWSTGDRGGRPGDPRPDRRAATSRSARRGGRSCGRLGIDPAAFAGEHPETALVLLDPFPAGSPFRTATGEDLLLSATGGFAWLCGDADGRPEHPKGEMAPTYAAVGGRPGRAGSA